MRTLVNMNPTAEFRAFDQMLGRLFGDSPIAEPTQGRLAMDIIEHDNKLVLTTAVPGIAPEELEISVDHNVLTIRGETKLDALDENDKVYRRELSYGAFSRSIRLPEGLDLENVDAEFNHGLVKISIPRHVPVKPEPKRISVRVADHTPEKVENTN